MINVKHYSKPGNQPKYVAVFAWKEIAEQIKFLNLVFVTLLRFIDTFVIMLF